MAAVEELIPGYGYFVVNGLRVSLGSAVLVLTLPILIYVFSFGKFAILWDFFVGTMAYIFYFPTYAIILPIYARCHLDDISSAAGLGARSGKLK